jgi:hypothetical protein
MVVDIAVVVAVFVDNVVVVVAVVADDIGELDRELEVGNQNIHLNLVIKFRTNDPINNFCIIPKNPQNNLLTIRKYINVFK